MQEVLEALERHEEFLILGHEDPDGDCLGSQLALSSFLKRQGKRCHLISHGPFRRPEIMEWAVEFTDKLPRPEWLDEGSTALVLLDCSSLERTGLDLTPYSSFPLIVIDHHASGEGGGNYRYLDTLSPSTTLLIQDIIEAFPGEMSEEEAEYIFFGFCTDTDYFRHLENIHDGVFLKIHRLMKRGISPTDFHRRIYAGQSLTSRKHLGKILNRTESHFDGRVLFTWENRSDFTEYDESQRDSNTLYKQLQSVKGALVVILAKESREGELSVSFRSSCDINVGELARSYGGGGHPKASGCTYGGSIDEFREEILGKFVDILANR
ncbi:MAG: bifunctional oligoribonuclease/PAP phosphatase NrnA [Spirochaetales bacterium]|nr:bifunctional oligoribonuclease/PAP phosphatase NrnA [Spirochaetales bacterium]